MEMVHPHANVAAITKNLAATGTTADCIAADDKPKNLVQGLGPPTGDRQKT